MRRQPSIADRLMLLAAQHHTRSVFQRFMRATREAKAVQRKVLIEKIRRNADSDFGRNYRFDSIHGPEDLARRVPILRYEDHQPYIDRVKLGDTRALLGGRQRVHMFAMTSGTTAEPKYIPVTDAFLREYRAGWNAFGIKALLDHPHGFLRGILQVSSRMDESRTPAGIPCGAITGLVAATQKRLVRKYYPSPQCVSRIEDPDAKYYTVMRLAVPADVAFAITASPATQLKLAKAADTHREQLIRDIHDGTLRADLSVSRDVREELRPRLKAEPAEAKRLEGLVAEHGRLLPKHYWDLAFLVNWTGGTMGLYLPELPEYFGDVPVRDPGLLASEGRMSVPVEDGTAAGILEVTSHYYEFVPVDRMDEASPAVVPCEGVEVGQQYFILLTTSSGLYRYHIGDVVRVVGFEGQAPIIEFLNKGAHTCSLTGEKLTERQVILAMEQCGRELGTTFESFVLAPCWGDPPCYVLHVEAGRAIGAGDAAGTLERRLQEVNVEYASKRHTQRLGAVRLNLLPDGFLKELDHREAESRRKGNEQYKHRYLYCRPGEDAGFPVGDRPR